MCILTVNKCFMHNNINAQYLQYIEVLWSKMVLYLVLYSLKSNNNVSLHC